MGADSRLQYQNQFIATDADKITTQTANTDEVLLAETTWDEVINGITAEGVVAADDFTPKAFNSTRSAGTLTGVATVDADFTDATALVIGAGAPTLVAADDLGVNTTDNTLYINDSGSARVITGLSEFFSSANAKWLGGGSYAEADSSDVDTDAEAATWMNSNIPSGIPSGVTYFWLNGTALKKATSANYDAGVYSLSGTSEERFHPVQPLIIESSLRGGGENIPLPYKTGNSAMTKDAPGPISVEEGMVFAGTGDGMEMFYRMMTQDKLPSSDPIHSTQITTEQTLIAAGALGDNIGTYVHSGIATPTLAPLSALNDDAGTGKVPVKLDVTPSAAPDSGKTGLVKIEGTDKDGLQIQEFLAWATGNATQKTKNYYNSVTRYSSSGYTAQTLKIACTDTSRKVTYTPQDEELVAFWFVRLVTGITPRLFSGVIGNSFEASLGRDAAIEWNVSCLGKRTWPNRNIRGEEWGGADGTDNTKGRRVKLDSSIGFANPTIFTGWQCELDIGGTRMALIDSTLSINQNLENSGVITGDRYEEAQPFRGTDREVMVDGTIVYSPENNLSQVYLDNTTLEDVNLNLRNRPRGGFYWLTRFNFPTTQINTNPDPASPRDGRISQAFNLKCFTEGVGGGPKDYSIETYVPDYTPVRDFS